MQKMLQACYFIFITLVLSGCQTKPIQAELISSDKLNPSAQQSSLPLQLRFFALNNVDKFKDASFKQLWLSSSKTLGKQLLGSYHIDLMPDSKQWIKLNIDKNARFLGVMAIFRHPQQGGWKKVVTLPLAFNLFPIVISVTVQNDLLVVNQIGAKWHRIFLGSISRHPIAKELGAAS